jgi:formyltetrahydrofolate deformylase
MSEQRSYILTISCPTGVGIVAAVTSYLADAHCNITEMSQFDDVSTDKFFSRIVFHVNAEKSPPIPQLEEHFGAVAEPFDMQWNLVDAARPMRVILMVSKADHCLVDLLYRKNKGDLNMDVVCVVSNHMDLRPIVEREGIRFVCMPVDKENKEKQEARLFDLVEETGTELIVLARYMQVFSDNACKVLNGKCINIHHSFLPGFKGARPYHQAFERGVKLIGATAHYITTDLDEGPIIEQAVVRVDHTHKPEALVAIGRDQESIALAQAVRLHIEQRVFVDGNRTVVFK